MSERVEVKFPKQYKPLPKGFKVVWSDIAEMFLGVCGEEIESPIFCCKYMARRWCFAFAAKQGASERGAER